jgi:photosystem II stability/assembly factor-like uncharacterized protein
MKKITLFLFVFIIVLTNNSFSQNWNYIMDSISIGDFNTVFFTSPSTGYASGSYGIMFKTTNGGDSWTSQTLSATYGINDIYFVNSNVGFATGDGGKIFKTTNAGVSWSSLTTGTTGNLRGIHFINTLQGYAVGYDPNLSLGVIIKTINGGSTWTILTGVTQYYNSNTLNAVYFSSIDTGYVYGAGNTRIRTVDGGLNWINMKASIYANGTTINWISISAPDKNTIFSASTNSSFIIKTSNLHGTPGNETITFAGGPFPIPYSCIHFISTTEGYVCGHDNNIYKTINGGTNYTAMPLGGTIITGETFTSIYMNNSLSGFMVGTYGRILRFSNTTSVPSYQQISNQINVSCSEGFISVVMEKEIYGTINIYDLHGKKYYSEPFRGNQKKIQCNLNSSIYLLQVTNGLQSWNEKIFIK